MIFFLLLCVLPGCFFFFELSTIRISFVRFRFFFHRSLCVCFSVFELEQGKKKIICGSYFHILPSSTFFSVLSFFVIFHILTSDRDSLFLSSNEGFDSISPCCGLSCAPSQPNTLTPSYGQCRRCRYKYTYADVLLLREWLGQQRALLLRHTDPERVCHVQSL